MIKSTWVKEEAVSDQKSEESLARPRKMLRRRQTIQSFNKKLSIESHVVPNLKEKSPDGEKESIIEVMRLDMYGEKPQMVDYRLSNEEVKAQLSQRQSSNFYLF